MPRRSSSPSLPEKKIPIVPMTINSHSHSQRPSFLQTMKEGIALGVGSSIGQRIVSAVFGEPTPRVGMMTTPQKPSPIVSEEYEQCMKKYDDVAVCKELLK